MSYSVVYKRFRQIRTPPALLAAPEMKYLAPWVRDEWGIERNLYKKKFGNAEEIVSLKKCLALQKKLIKAMHKDGVRILTGTDAMNMGVVPGFSLQEELRNLVELGFTPFEAIQAATQHPAEFLSRAGEFGTVTVGKHADLLLVEHNPLKDISVLSRPAGVMVRGRWFPQEELRRRLGEVPTEYAKEKEFVTKSFVDNPKGLIQYLDYNDPLAGLLNSIVDSVADAVIAQGAENFREMHKTAKAGSSYSPLVQGRFIYLLGQQMLQRGKTREAIEVLKLNVETYPNAASVHHELAEAYAANSETDLAVKHCKITLELDPKNESALGLLKKLGAEPKGKT